MDKKILKFIIENETSDVASLLLGSSVHQGVDILFAVKAIEGRKKTKKKIPLWYKCPSLLYPNSISLEQSSSEKTGSYKKCFIPKDGLIADFTGGLGVDSYFFSLIAQQVDYYERSQELSSAAAYNFKELKRENISIHNTTIDEHYINTLASKKYDLIYLDPARRGGVGERLFSITQCEPNILELKDSIFKITDTILLKLSPMIDITATLCLLPQAQEVHIISVANECKEVLVLLKKDNTITDPLIKTINFSGNDREDTFSFHLCEEANASSTYYDKFRSDAQLYLYEPNTSILKSGAFKLIGNKYVLDKIATNTHLYLSANYHSDFPGKIFKVVSIDDFNKTTIKNLAKTHPKGSVSARNIPINSESLKKKLKIKDGDTYHFFGVSFQNGDKKIITTV